MNRYIDNSFGCALCSHEGKISKGKHKVEEALPFGELGRRHPMSSYLCNKHYNLLMQTKYIRKKVYCICA